MSLGAKGDKLAASNGKKYYLDVKMDGDDMVIDNYNVFRTVERGRPVIPINKTLALQMKWFVENEDQHFNIKLGSNLVMSLYEDEIPDMLDVTDGTDRTMFWKVDGDFIQLSVFCSWRFIRLNEAFRAHWQIDDRTLYVLSDVVSSSIVGDKTEDLLRSFHYKKEPGCDMFHLDPRHIHYRPVRKAFFQVIKTTFKETDGREVKFNRGDCTITLHFKRHFLATT